MSTSNTTEMINFIKKMEHRPNWDEYFIMMAYIISKRSTCHKINVGCVLTKNNRIIATGYNGHIAGCPHDSIIKDEHEMATIHAETNTIASACKYGIALEGAIAYITHFPCINCTKNLIASGIKTIVYAEDYNNDEIAITLLNLAKIIVVKFNA